MKTAWENGDDPNSPPKTATRKRGASTSTKNATVKDDDNFRYTPDSDDQKTDANYKPSKKRKTATPKKATPKKLPVAKTVSPKEIAASPKKEPQETQVSDIIQTEPNSAADTFTFEDVYAGTNNIYSGTLGGLNASGTVPNLNNGLAINNIASQPSTGDADFNSHFMSPMYTHQQAYYNPAPQASFNGTGGIATSNASMSNHYTMPAYLSAATHAAPSKPIPAFQDTDLFPDLLDFGGYRNTGVGIDGNVAASGVTGSTPAEMVTNNNTGDPAVSDGYNAQVGSQARPVNDLFSSSSSSGWMMMMNGDEEV
ncbi:unnamed protein product [Periconia digitata]|uniref:Uncharacterized protein n=1 Tax=Periconia digitata TaxID=1303443 RepID=A0A9W4U747_9PLEO|nr:unnamed protein product [Periconia digitata]